jgi:hypothetical protein
MNKITIELSTLDILHILECTSYLDACGVVQRVMRKLRKGIKEEKKDDKERKSK